MTSTKLVWGLLEQDIMTGPHERLTRFDSVIRAKGVDSMSVLEAFNGGFPDATIEEVDTALDSVYAAADAGNRHAHFLIHAAASKLVLEAGEEASAFPGGFQVTGEELEDYALYFRFADRRHKPEPNTLKAVATLDESIAAIEITLENVKNGLVSEAS